MKRPVPLWAGLCAALLSLSACGLQPMYAGGGSGAVGQGLAAVEVPPIEGRAGWLMRKDNCIPVDRENPGMPMSAAAVVCEATASLPAARTAAWIRTRGVSPTPRSANTPG